MEKPDKITLVNKVNNTNETYQHHRPSDMIDWEGDDVTSEEFLPKMYNLNWIIRKHQTPRDFLQNNWSVFFKSDMVMKDKHWGNVPDWKRLRRYDN